MADRRVRVGVLGAGAWARVAHLPGFCRDPRCELVAIADPVPGLAEAAAREFGIAASTTRHAELIERPDIDLVDVCTPSATHFELTWAALEAGKHVLCEKPVAYDFRDTLRARDLARERALKTKVGLTFRYSPGMRYVKALIDEGFIGTPFIFNGYEQNSQWLRPSTPLRQVDPDADPGVIQVSSLEGYGAPIIDLAHWFVGSDLASVVGTMRNFVPERMVRATGRMMRMNIDDGDIFLGEFANGALCSIQTSFVTVGNYPGLEARIYGSEGALICRLVEEFGCCETVHGARPDSVEFQRIADSGPLLPAGRLRRGELAHALLREPGVELHRRSPRRLARRRGRFRGWRLGAGDDQRRRAIVPRAALGDLAAGPRVTTVMTDPLSSFFESYYRLRPVDATFAGVHAHDARLPDWSTEGLEAAVAEMRVLRREVGRQAGLAVHGRPEWIDLHLADAFLEIQIAEIESGHFQRGNPSLYTGEAIFGFLSVLTRGTASFGDRLAPLVARLAAVPAFLDQARRTLRGAPIAAEWIARALRECEAASDCLGAGIELWLAHHAAGGALPANTGGVEDPLRAVRTMLAMCTCAADPDIRAVRRAAAGARAAFAGFAEWLRREARASDAGGAAACGEEFFDLLLRRGHWCNQSAPELLAEARDAFDRQAALVADAVRRAGADSWPDAAARLAEDHAATGEYLSTFDETWRACRGVALDHDLVSWPDAVIRFVPIPIWTREAAPKLYYLFYRSPAPFDPQPVHECLVPPVDAMMPDEERKRVLRAANRSVIKLNYVVHHAGLGHHVQNAAAARSRSRIGQVAAVDGACRIGMFCGGTMAEGWACYATDMMEQCGALSPLEEASEAHGRLRQLARAIVDVELHRGTMTLVQAEQFYVERVGMAPSAARSEACKNAMFPGAAIMYWLGTRAIHRLRAERQLAEGVAFSLRRFHDRLLELGSIPVEMRAALMRDEANVPRGSA